MNGSGVLVVQKVPDGIVFIEASRIYKAELGENKIGSESNFLGNKKRWKI